MKSVPSRKKLGTALVFYVVFCTLALWVSSVTHAQKMRKESEQELKRIEQQTREDDAGTRKLEAKNRQNSYDIKGARGQLIAAANSIRNLEDRLTQLEQNLYQLEQDEHKKGLRLEKNSQKLARILSALQRIALQPPEAIIAAPGNPLDTVRSALVLETALPGIERQVKALRRELTTFAELRQRISTDRAELLTTRQNLKTQQGSIRKLLARKKAQEKKNAATLKQRRNAAKALAKKAKNLRDLLTRLKDTAPRPKPRPKEQGTPPLNKNQIRAFPTRTTAALLNPVRGSVTQNFQQSDQISFHEGIVIVTRARAQVVAPYDGRIVYTGDFRGYGKIIIIEHSQNETKKSKNKRGYHSLIAGVGEIAVSENQLVLAGEPLAWMSDAPKPEVYYELRQAGRPINPQPWLKK